MIQLGPDIWTALGPHQSTLGFHYPTRMVVIRLADGGLFVWSPIALTPDLQGAVDALGPVRHLIAPNTLHHMSLGDWQAAYPHARTHGAPGLPAKRSDLVFDDALNDTPCPDWAGQIDQCVVQGNAITTEVVFFHRASATVLFTDLIQHFPRDWFTGWRAVVARLDLMTAPVPSVPRKFRLTFRDRGAARAALATITAWPANTLVMAHGAPVKDAQAVIKRAFGWL